jgi:hypothetical protein
MRSATVPREPLVAAVAAAAVAAGLATARAGAAQIAVAPAHEATAIAVIAREESIVVRNKLAH